MPAIEYSSADRICHVWRDEKPVHAPARDIRHAASHVSLVRLRRPDAQRDLIHLLPSSCATQRCIDLAHWPYDSPTEEALMDALPRRGTGLAVVMTRIANL